MATPDDNPILNTLFDVALEVPPPLPEVFNDPMMPELPRSIQTPRAAGTLAVAGEDNSPFAELQDAFVNFSESIGKGTEKLVQEARRTTGVGDVLLKATDEIFTSRAIQANVSDAADLQAQNARIETFEAVGGVGGLQSFMRDFAETSKEVQSAQNEIEVIRDREFTGISIIDDIINDFSSVQERSKLDAAERRLDNLNTIISNASAQTEGAARAINTTKKTLNTASILAKNKENQALTMVAIGEQELKNIQNNAVGLERVMRANSSLMTAHIQNFSAYNTGVAAEQRKIEHEQGVLEHDQRVTEYLAGKETRALKLESDRLALESAIELNSPKTAALRATYQKTLKNFEDAKILEASLVNSVNKGLVVMGLEPQDGPTIINGITSTGATGARYRVWGNIGSSTNLVLGTTAADSAISLAIVSAEGFAVEETSATKILGQIQDAVIASRPVGAKPPKSVAEAKAEFNRIAAAFTASQALEVSEASNIYHAAPMTVLAEFESVALSPLYKKVIEPLGLAEVDAETILDHTIAAVADKTLTMEEANSGINSLFQAAISNNNMQKMYHRAVLPHQETYNVKLKVPISLAPQRLAAFPSIPVAFVTTEQIFEPTKMAADRLLGTTFAGKRITVDLADPVQTMQILVAKAAFLGTSEVIPGESTLTNTKTE